MVAPKDIYEGCTACTHSRQIHADESGRCRAYECPCHSYEVSKDRARTAMVPVREVPRDTFVDDLDELEADELADDGGLPKGSEISEQVDA